MKAALLVLVVAAQQGYWIGGQPQEISVAWNLADGAAAPAGARLHGELRLAGLAVHTVEAAMPAGGADAVTVAVEVPRVRVRAPMTWAYRVTAADGAELAQGELPVSVFPAGILEGAGRRLRDRRTLVWDAAEGLPAALEQTAARFTRIDSAEGLAFARADLVLVGVDQLTGQPLEQSRLLAQAEQGGTVVVFAQRGVDSLAGYGLAPRAAAVDLDWRARHPLLAYLEERDLADWAEALAGADEQLQAILLPADEPALAVAAWPEAVPSADPAPIDALLVVKAVGRGRLVLCQLPTQEWTDEPRSQLLLRGVLNYAATRPEPTPPPSRRRAPQPPPPASERTILVPSGATE